MQICKEKKKKKNHPDPLSPKNSIYIENKEVFTKMHYNQLVKNQRQRDNFFPFVLFYLSFISSYSFYQRIFKAAKEKQLNTYKETSIRLSVGFSPKTLQTKIKWNDTLKVLKEKKTANQKHTQQSRPSKRRERQRPSQTNQN